MHYMPHTSPLFLNHGVNHGYESVAGHYNATAELIFDLFAYKMSQPLPCVLDITRYIF